MKRIVPLIMMLSLLAATPVWAVAAPPDQVARETADMALHEIRARKDELRSDPNKLYQLVEEKILPHFDFERISQLVLGKHWRDADEAQRQRFSHAFQGMLVRSYSRALVEYDSVRIEWAPLRMAPGTKDVVVHSNILRKDGPPFPINYNLHLKNGQWMVYDVTLADVSLVNNFRGMFASQIRQSGLDALIARLEEKQASH